MAVPRFIVVERQREEKAITEVEDLLWMFAFRNSIGTQQLGLHYDKPAGMVSLWILDLNPKKSLLRHLVADLEHIDEGQFAARPHPPRIAAALLAFGKPAHVAVKALGDEVG
mgnify:CR=1 FL=1